MVKQVQMKSAEDKRWERLQQVLRSGISGDSPKIASTRTLFGIKSHVEEVIDRVVDKENDRTTQIIESNRKTNGND